MSAIRMRTPNGTMDDVEAVPMAVAKNSLAEVLASAREAGVVALTRHGKVEAVVLPADVYDEVMRRSGDPLEKMRDRFDRMVASMQGPAAALALDRVFGPVPDKSRPARPRRRVAR